ncbi:hypothetical protein STEG23_006877 [Scotinomys teguina]
MEEFDSEDLSTSDKDEDYVPSGGDYSEDDDVNELVKEDEVDGEDQAEKTKGKRRKAQSLPAKKRKHSGLLSEDEEEDGKEDSGGGSSGAEEEEQGGLGSENARKKKEDELWASFLNDVGPKSKAAPSSQVKAAEETEETSSNKLLVKTDELEKQPKESEKVKITKVFDFAGEEVRVTKEVDATSKEAKSFFKQNEKENPQAVVTSAAPPLPAGSGIKRPSVMSTLLGKIGAQKQKMSTLEKSKLDWESFKEEEGTGEELAIHNRGKEGYIERKAFLDRVDHRQCEIERDLGLSKMKP